LPCGEGRGGELLLCLDYELDGKSACLLVRASSSSTCQQGRWLGFAATLNFNSTNHHHENPHVRKFSSDWLRAAGALSRVRPAFGPPIKGPLFGHAAGSGSGPRTGAADKSFQRPIINRIHSELLPQRARHFVRVPSRTPGRGVFGGVTGGLMLSATDF